MRKMTPVMMKSSIEERGNIQILGRKEKLEKKNKK